MESLEELIYGYFRHSGDTVSSLKVPQWIAYFKKHATFRTVCHDCHDQIVDNYRQERKRINREEKMALKNIKKAN